MAIEIQSVSEVDSTELAQKEELLREFMAEEFPDIDTSTGSVFHSRVLRPAALLHAIAGDNFDRLRQSQSLALVEEDPSLAEDDVVDNILSNFLITRTPGAQATGQAVIVITENVTTVIAAGAEFAVGDLTFVTPRAFTGVTDSSLINSSADRLIQPRIGGGYSFIVDLEASEVGEQYRLKQDTELDMPLPPPGFVRAFAAADFTGGREEQTNEDLIAELATGVSTKVLAGRNNIEALLRDNFPDITHLSIVGYGDAEMTRDRNNIFGASHGGKADLYIAPDVRPTVQTVQKTATLLSPPEDQVLQATFTLDDTVRAFYDITKVLPVGSDLLGTLEIIEVTRSIDVTGEGFIPELPTAAHGAFTAFQTVTVKFKDPAFLFATETEGEYDFSVVGLPNIPTLQDFISSRDRRNPNADYLMKAAVPILVGVSVTIDKLASELTDTAELDATRTALQTEIARRVNAIGFAVGKLPASLVVAAAASQLSGSATVASPVELSGTLIRPDGIVQSLFSTVKLEVPDLPEIGVSQRTTLFFLNPQDVLVTFNDVDVVEV